MSEISSQDPQATHRHNETGLQWPLIMAGTAIGLGIYLLSRRTKAGAGLASAGLFALRKVAELRPSSTYKAHASFAINCSPTEAYRFWHDFENLPRFMRHVDSVRDMGNNRLEWTVLGPMEAKLRWTAQIVEDRENSRIAWRSLPGSQIQNKGSIEFHPGTDERGTLVSATIEYLQPAGSVGKALISMLGKDPQFTVREDLRRFKSLLETNEVPTTLGQPHGPRGLHGHGLQMMLREKQNLPSPPLYAKASNRLT